jgi:hypothetical protein
MDAVEAYFGVDAGVQLSAFTREATLHAHVATAMLSGDLKHGVEPFSKEDCDSVVTHIGGMSLFFELDLTSGEERFTERPFKDIACNNELADQMLTEVGDLSIFIESNLDSLREHDRIIDTTMPKEEGKQEAVIKALFGLQPHAETSASQCNFCVTSRSRKDARAMQLPNDHFLSKMPSWRRSGFSHGYYLQTHLGIMPSGSREVQLRVLHYYLRGGQEIERLQAALNWLLKVTNYTTGNTAYAGIITALLVQPKNAVDLHVTETFSLFTRNDADTDWKSSRLRRSFLLRSIWRHKFSWSIWRHKFSWTPRTC